ncbi:hypothetical protein QYE76_053227 [Lolium multiflorum]|uniref:Retrotransposon gag domain-containing protein n=1 Tax=Lolium multiflorum TaxID=4521 RepID=A0AAD8SV97_LOLMU|nr:hypothetical protein QYE76_053227 [Lolium multiflorum]
MTEATITKKVATEAGVSHGDAGSLKGKQRSHRPPRRSPSPPPSGGGGGGGRRSRSRSKNPGGGPRDARERLNEYISDYIGPKFFGRMIREEPKPRSLNLKLPGNLKHYDGERPDTWIEDYYNAVTFAGGTPNIACRMLQLYLVGPSRIWLSDLEKNSIFLLVRLEERLREKHFRGTYKRPATTSDLQACIQKKGETSRNFLTRWYVEHQDPGEDVTPWSREGEEQLVEKMHKKLDPKTIEELEEGREAGRPRTRSTGPDRASGPGPVRWHALATARTWLEDLRDDARCQGPLSGLGSLRLFVLLNHCPPVGFRVTHTRPVGQSSATSTSTPTSEMAEEQITYEDLPAEHKKKCDELKAICEAELIGSFAKARLHGIKVKGGTRSSPGVNMVDLSHSIREPGFSFGVNMAGLVIRHSTGKAESSHSRGKDKEEAVPRDRPQDDDRRYLTEEEVRSIRYQRPLSVHLLNKYEQQYDRRRRHDEDDERYRRSDAADRRYRQHDRNNDGYELHARGRSREQDDVDKHWDCPSSNIAGTQE